MRYFHRTSLAPDEVIAAADAHFGTRLQMVESGSRARTFEGTLGRIEIQVTAEGGHYTLITLKTDQVGESELDTFGKSFLTAVHTKAAPRHVARGAY
jgi:hypothetical protein